MRPFRPAPFLLALLAITGGSALAVDAQPPVAPEAATPAADDHGAADRAADVGRKALQLYRKDQAGNPHAVVDAAMAFTEAHKRYTALGDADAVAEMQANIYWCKKQMNLDAVKEYLGREGKSEALAQVDAVAEKQVDASEAQGYFDRARKFAADHPNDFADISVRYYEVATRFVGTPVSLEAQKLSLEAQNKYMQWIQSGGMQRETRFTKATAVTGTGKVAIPDEKAVKSTIAELKKLYAKDYAGKSDPQKRRFASKLVAEAIKSKGDATIYYTTLQEAIRLAQEAEDYERLLDTIDLAAGSFQGFDAKDQKKQWLRKLTGKPTAGAIATLLDAPTDPAANALAGKFFCFQLKRWDQGLPMLALCSDADLKAVAEQELAKPTEDAQRLQVGDAWFALTKKGGASNERFSAMARAQHWYQQAKGVTGVAKERISQRLADIDKALPLDMDNVDWDNLTPSQWGKLKGQGAVVQVRVDRSGPVATLKPGQRVRVVPHPSDTWTCQSWTGMVSSTWAGTEVTRQGRDGVEITMLLSFSTPYSSFRFGELLCQVDKGDPQSCGVISGPGNVWMVPNRPGGDNKGEIRIKLVPVDDE